MKRWMLYFTMVAISLLADVNAFSQEQAEAPTFKDGDFWQFRVREWDWITQRSNALNGLYEVSYSQGRVEVFEVIADQKANLGRRPSELLALLGLSKNPGFEHDLKFPLSVGQKWNHDYRTKIVGTRDLHARRVEFQVLGVEDVTTPAGTFRAFKIVKEDWSGPTSRWVTTYYYSPDTGSVVKSYYDSSIGTFGAGGKREIELVQFGSAR